MDNKKDWNPIKLKAVDDQDLQVFSQCLYEAIVVSAGINYDHVAIQFAMGIERFTWEHAGENSHFLMQVLSILVVNNVEKIDIS